MALRLNEPQIVRALLAAGADRTRPRAFGEETTMPTELADEREPLQEALKTATGWTPENHGLFSGQLREQVKAVLLVSKAKGWSLPDDALAEIFSKLVAVGKGA